MSKLFLNLLNKFEAAGDIEAEIGLDWVHRDKKLLLTPSEFPPSKREVDHIFSLELRLPTGEVMRPEYDISIPLADPCPTCGAFNMTVGDWIYLGCCVPCSGGPEAFF